MKLSEADALSLNLFDGKFVAKSCELQYNKVLRLMMFETGGEGMTTLYLIRHAEAEGNLYRRIHGQYDSLITTMGTGRSRRWSSASPTPP